MTHPVVRGETLSSIGAKYGKSYQELARINGIRPPYNIREGQNLIITNEPPSNPKVTIRIVNPFYWAITELECIVTYNGATHTLTTDGDGYLPTITTQHKQDKIIIEAKRWVGGYKKIAEVNSGNEPKVVPIISPWHTVTELLQLDRPNHNTRPTTPPDVAPTNTPTTRLPNGPTQTEIDALIAKLHGNMLITKEMVKAVAPGKEQDENLMYYLNFYADKYEVNTKLRVAHFLAQCAHESGGFRIRAEGKNYTLSQALSTWPTRSNDINALPRHHRSNGTECPNQPDLFNSVYATQDGNDQPGDGFKYRGRGLIQITGRNKYKDYTTEHNHHNPNELRNFETNPDLVSDNIAYSVESAFWYWRKRGACPDDKDINTLADLGASDEVVYQVSSAVNGWKKLTFSQDGYVFVRDHVWLRKTKGHDDRLHRFHAIKNLLNLQ